MKIHLGLLHTACKKNNNPPLAPEHSSIRTLRYIQIKWRGPWGLRQPWWRGIRSGWVSAGCICEWACACVSVWVLRAGETSLFPVSQACWMWWVVALMVTKMPLHSKSRNLHRKRWGIREGRNQAAKQFGVKIFGTHYVRPRVQLLGHS